MLQGLLAELLSESNLSARVLLVSHSGLNVAVPQEVHNLARGRVSHSILSARKRAEGVECARIARGFANLFPGAIEFVVGVVVACSWFGEK